MQWRTVLGATKIFAEQPHATVIRRVGSEFRGTTPCNDGASQKRHPSTAEWSRALGAVGTRAAHASFGTCARQESLCPSMAWFQFPQPPQPLRSFNRVPLGSPAGAGWDGAGYAFEFGVIHGYRNRPRSDCRRHRACRPHPDGRQSRDVPGQSRLHRHLRRLVRRDPDPLSALLDLPRAAARREVRVHDAPHRPSASWSTRSPASPRSRASTGRSAWRRSRSTTLSSPRASASSPTATTPTSSATTSSATATTSSPISTRARRSTARSATARPPSA